MQSDQNQNRFNLQGLTVPNLEDGAWFQPVSDDEHKTPSTSADYMTSPQSEELGNTLSQFLAGHKSSISTSIEEIRLINNLSSAAESESSGSTILSSSDGAEGGYFY